MIDLWLSFPFCLRLVYLSVDWWCVCLCKKRSKGGVVLHHPYSLLFVKYRLDYRTIPKSLVVEPLAPSNGLDTMLDKYLS